MTTSAMTRLTTQIDRITNQFNTTRSRRLLAKLVDLPLEVLVEILVLLEWKDILRIRQTCQRLRDASLSRPVWLSLVQWYSATIQPRPFFLEKPLELYTDRELEHVILKWQSGKFGWEPIQPRELALSIPEDYLQSVHLLQGGRWLLFGTRNGSIKYHDLSSQGGTSEAVTLVPSHFGHDANTIVLISVDIDVDAEYTTFNLGIMSSRAPPYPFDEDYPNPPRYVRWIEVSRVTSYWDENGQVLGLRAERLACFPEVFQCGCDSFTIGRRYVAYSISSYEPSSSMGDGDNIAIVDWTSVDPNSLAYPRMLFWRRRAKWLALLPDDRLLCNDTSEILLFDLRDAAMTTLLPTHQDQPPSQDPIAFFELWVIAISQPYCVHDSIRFSVLIEEGVKGLIIPRTKSSSRTKMDCVDLLSRPNFNEFAQMGYARAVLCRLDEPTMLQYVWPEEHSSAVVSERGIIHTPFPEFIFDEYSSRLISLGVGEVKEFILAGWVVESILDLAAIS